MKITDELLYAHAAAGQALWLSTLPDPAELDPFVPSRWFQRKMKSSSASAAALLGSTPPFAIPSGWLWPPLFRQWSFSPV